MKTYIFDLRRDAYGLWHITSPHVVVFGSMSYGTAWGARRAARTAAKRNADGNGIAEFNVIFRDAM
jgi:hypothetical protein